MVLVLHRGASWCSYTLNANGSTSAAVVNQYFHEHFPKAIATANALRARGGKLRYRWMTQSWLVSAFRHCATTKVVTPRSRQAQSTPRLHVVCPT